jgi:GTPase KRas
METFKTVIMGDTGVGKSAFIIRFIQGIFVGDFDPTNEDSYRKKIEVNKKKCYLDILDTHAHEEYHAMNGRYIHIAQAAIIAYSITDEKSFLSVENIAARFFNDEDSDYILFIVGMKCDAEDKRAVSYEAGKEISQKLKATGFFEASSLNNINVHEIFEKMASSLISFENSEEWEETVITIKKKSGCWIL